MKRIIGFFMGIALLISQFSSALAVNDAQSWLQTEILLNGNRDGDETISYLYTVNDRPILGLFTDESQYSLRYFPGSGETRMELMKTEKFGSITIIAFSHMSLSGELFNMVVVNNAPVLWATVTIDPKMYTAGGDYEIEDYADIVKFRETPKDEYVTYLSDCIDSSLELFATFLADEASSYTLADFGFETYKVSNDRISPLLDGDLTDINMFYD